MKKLIKYTVSGKIVNLYKLDYASKVKENKYQDWKEKNNKEEEKNTRAITGQL